jgi:hypothetical protein
VVRNNFHIIRFLIKFLFLISCSLRRASAAARLLGLSVLIPPGHGCLFLVIVMCCKVAVSASGWPLVQRSPTECGGSECDHESSTMRRPWPIGDVAPW